MAVTPVSQTTIAVIEIYRRFQTCLIAGTSPHAALRRMGRSEGMNREDVMSGGAALVTSLLGSRGIRGVRSPRKGDPR
jgi:hypothetical protein